MKSELIRNNSTPTDLVDEGELIARARSAAGDVVRPNDEVAVHDDGDRWSVKFAPQKKMLGGGVRVSIAKDDLRVLAVVCSQ